MRAGELRDFGEIEQLSGSDWSNYASAYFAIEVSGENEGSKTYNAKTRKTNALTYIVGLRNLNEGFSILVNLDGQQKRLVISSAIVAGPRREEIHFQCHEIEP